MNFEEKRKQEVDINININVNEARRETLRLPNQSLQKLKTPLSVNQLAYFCKVLYDLKVIQSNNQTDVFKFIAENFETPNSKDISLQSLRSKYYIPDSKTKEAVKEIAIKMLNFINSDIKSQG